MTNHAINPADSAAAAFRDAPARPEVRKLPGCSGECEASGLFVCSCRRTYRGD